jgi:hypothetical protein
VIRLYQIETPTLWVLYGHQIAQFSIDLLTLTLVFQARFTSVAVRELSPNRSGIGH